VYLCARACLAAENRRPHRNDRCVHCCLTTLCEAYIHHE
jgi:hypothetical protein